jgi:3-phenylpropionate/trans-cinnamate dioxygenase ferredoxin reductase subunit
MPHPGMVIVGAGEAGARAASALRENGWHGPVTLIGDEIHPPYERPPLSKAVMVAETDPLATTILSDERLKDQDIRLLCGCAAVAIDRPGRTVVLADGRRVPYGKLLLATGSDAGGSRLKARARRTCSTSANSPMPWRCARGCGRVAISL